MSRGKTLLKKIKKLRGEIEALSDQELAAKTKEFRDRLDQGENLMKLLPEAFAVVCEADFRILGMYPYDVQILGAIALAQNHLVEMYTGEGKTLTATMPLYLNGLTGKGAVLVTANAYLAIRDAKEMGPVYEFLGLTVGVGVSKEKTKTGNEDKKAYYGADVLYTTQAAMCFDYLINNLVKSAEDRFLRDFYAVIIDEADTVLLDAASMPLVISGAPRVQSNLFDLTDTYVSTLEEDKDYELEEKAVWLTKEGVEDAERFFGIKHFYSKEQFELNRHVTLALRAHTVMTNEKEYIVSDEGEIVLLDNGAGRTMPGMRLQGGQHQAIETKEGCERTQEQRSVASITYQNFFRMFPKMSGMSGTLYDARKELRATYHKKVVRIQPNKKNQRKDLKDRYFQTAEEQTRAVVMDVKKRHKKGQPVLVVTPTIQDTELISSLLVEEKIPHSLLNANNAFWEADIIKEAGQYGSVTVSTGMAGRGTDIRLGKGVQELGGLAVLGNGRMGNVRQEKQARGRAGRQGDPGSSQFFVSLEDELVSSSLGKDKLEKLLQKRFISKHHLKRIIDGIQKKGEENEVSNRENSFQYDKVLKRQREILYAARNRLLDKGYISQEVVQGIVSHEIHRYLSKEKNPDKRELQRYILDHLSYHLDVNRIHEGRKKKLMEQELVAYAADLFHKKMEEFEDENRQQEYLRRCILKALDEAWIEEVDYLQQLQYATAGRSMAQLNPLFEYNREAYESYHNMEDMMQESIERFIFLGRHHVDDKGDMQIVFP